ncbi:unnamed protein product, partial [Ectocarpus sp. 12 AP-2014]
GARAASRREVGLLHTRDPQQMERKRSGRVRQPVAMMLASRKALVVRRRRRRWRRSRFTKGAFLLVAVCAAESQQRAHAFISAPSGVHASRGATMRSSPRLQAEPSEEDDFSRLVRRMNHLERVVSDQSAEVEELRSSMEHMRMIIEIQARIDSCLVGEDGEDGLLLSSDLAGDKGREPDPWLVKQAIRLLRIRHRVLRAWEFDGDDLENNNDGDEHVGGETTVGFPPTRSGSGGSDSGRKPSGGGGAGGGGDEARRRRRRSRMRTRDGRAFGFDNDEFYEYSMYDDTPVAGPGARGDGVPGDGGGRGESKSRRDGGEFEARLEKRRPPKTNQDAADAAGAGVVAALMEGRRRLIVEVDDSQLRYNSPDFCHEALAEFVELLVLPLTTALENLKARQNRCKIVIQGAHHASQVKEAMVLDAPASLQVVSLSDAKVAKKDRVV